MSRMINTVNGPVSSDSLGAVLSHEHFLFGYPGYQGDLSFDAFDGEYLIEQWSGIFERLAPHGVKTVVDPTPNECGRDPVFLQTVSQELGINIICATGYYFEGMGASPYFKFRSAVGFDVQEEIQQLMERELYEGIMDTGIKAGIIKLASGAPQISDFERWFFDAAGRIAAKDREVRIVTHTTDGACLREQADLLMKHGVDPRQVSIGHVCSNRDMDLQIALCKEGFFLAYDQYALENWAGSPTDGERNRRIVQLFEAGCGDHLLISTDKIAWGLGRESSYPPDMVEKHVKNQHWPYIFERVLPELEALGLSAQEARKLTNDNPARFFGKI